MSGYTTNLKQAICGGKYKVLYTEVPKKLARDCSDYSRTFIGTLENFNPSGNCAFFNEETQEVLVVDYNYIILMRSIGQQRKEST